MLEHLLARQAKADADREQMLAKMDTNQAERKTMQEDIKYGQQEIRSLVDAWMTDMNDDRKETTACQDEMEGTYNENGAKFGRKGGRSGAARDF
jgi:hypothetical protein